MTAQHPSELEDVIAEVADSYGAGRLIDSLEHRHAAEQAPGDRGAQPPEGRHVPGLLRHRASSTRASCAIAVAAHLYPAYEILVRADPARRELRGLPDRGRAAADADWPRSASRSRSCSSIPRIRALLSKDVLAAFQGDPAANSVEEVIFSYPSIEAITIHRIAHELYRAGRADAPAHHDRARAPLDRHRHPSRRRDRRVVLHRPRHGRRHRRDERDRQQREDLPGRDAGRAQRRARRRAPAAARSAIRRSRTT